MLLERWNAWLNARTQTHPAQEDAPAVPEIHTGKVRHTDVEETPEPDAEIHYENVAIPEIHLHPKKK